MKLILTLSFSTLLVLIGFSQTNNNSKKEYSDPRTILIIE